MKSSPTCTRRRSSLLVSSALLLTTDHCHVGANNLRRSSSSSSSSSHTAVVEGEGIEVVSSNDRLPLENEGFEAVGGATSHEPLVNSEHFEWHRSMLQEDEVGEAEEEDFEPKEYINDERLAFVEPLNFEAVGGATSHEPLVNGTEWHRSILQEDEAGEGERDLEHKYYINYETLSFVDPSDPEHNRVEKTCGNKQMLWMFDFTTDDYGYEFSWKLERRTGNNMWTDVTSGPPPNTKYHDGTSYRGATCLDGAEMYKLTVVDARSDGMCCNYGKGTYSYSVNGINEYDSSKQRTFTKDATHAFYVGMPVPANNGNGNSGIANQNNPVFQAKSSSCGQNKQRIGIKFVADKYGPENSWELLSLSTNRVVKQKGLGSFQPNSSDMTEVCVPYGKYRFTLKDGVGDGICCGEQGDGRYEIYMDGERIIYGSDFTYGKDVKHVLIAGYHTQLNQMSQREIQYLNCHNWRRKQYHEQYGATYVPLKYDLSLADDAQYWADELLKDCHIDGIKHEPGVEQGENLAKNMGSPRSDFGRIYPVENICRRWFEREVGWPYPDNAHLTQGLWRSANYVGCAESTKTMEGGGQCHIQVCRYARAGNCNMGKYQSKIGENWKKPMLQDHNPCGPVCPGKGCH